MSQDPFIRVSAIRSQVQRDHQNEGTSPSLDVSDAWFQCAKTLHEHDEVTVKAWKEDIDTLLVFVSVRMR